MKRWYEILQASRSRKIGLSKVWAEDGYEVIQSEYYEENIFSKFNSSSVKVWDRSLSVAFDEGILDHSSLGNRVRCHTDCKISEEGFFTFGKFKPYLQPLKFDPITGGLIREYADVSRNLLENEVFQSLLMSDIDYVSTNSDISPAQCTIGIHLMRYVASSHSPAYSSPPWLHKEKEELVFIHHIRTSEHMIGGDTVIAPNDKEIKQVFKLSKHLDSLVMSHKVFHAVSPMGSSIASSAVRDIILITFER